MAIEIDEELAPRAQQNLESLAQVEVIHGDGAAIDLGHADSIFVNAGVNFPIASWLDALNPGGRIVFPLITMRLITVRRFNHSRAGGRPSRAWSGRSIGVMLLARRECSGLSVKPI